jgi:probable rRNA maturation factor
MIYTQIDERYQSQVGEPLLVRAAQASLAQQSAPVNGELTIVVSGDEEIRVYNRQYLDNDVPTDVLSFPGDEIDPETGAIYLGDIIISYPRALAQSQAGQHTLENELELLVVHGVLHLLGHDHAEADEKAAMWSAQAAILQSLGNPLAERI